MDHQAFAQLLGNCGEFVGAIAVFVTLFYLTIQIRHSNRQNQRDAIRHLEALNAFVEQQHQNIVYLAGALLDFPSTREIDYEHREAFAPGIRELLDAKLVE